MELASAQRNAEINQEEQLEDVLRGKSMSLLIFVCVALTRSARHTTIFSFYFSDLAFAVCLYMRRVDQQSPKIVHTLGKFINLHCNSKFIKH